MQSKTIPDARLLSALPFLTHGGRCIDVGTDHAYLPIHLVANGICREALACDINEGPLASAREHILEFGLADRIDTRLTDGLHGLCDYSPDDIMIFGMGGELIVKILQEAPWVKDREIGLILQPMSRASVLRQYLTQNGFAITGEALSKSGRIYQTLHARYCGKNETYTEEELLLGRQNILNPSPLFCEFVRHELSVCQKVIRGKERSESADCSDERRMERILIERLEKLQ